MAEKNYMSIFGKFASKCKLLIDLSKVNLDPLLASDQIVVQQKRRLSQHQEAHED